MQQLLSDFIFAKTTFVGIENVFSQFHAKKMNACQKNDFLGKALLSLIEKEKEPCFLLPAVLDFIYQVNDKKLLEHYSFHSFELWLNQFSGLDFNQNLRVRGKIAGKYLPRESYQTIFPIGMGQVYEGSHFVTAHISPDLDSSIASFWGWLDAFAARVSKGMHYWNVPGGLPKAPIEMDLLFKEPFGLAIFTHLLKNRSILTLTANDLMTQEGLIKQNI